MFIISPVNDLLTLELSGGANGGGGDDVAHLKRILAHPKSYQNEL